MMSVFGLIVDGGNDIGFPLSTTDESGGSVASKEEVITPLLDILTKFREKVRLAAIAGDTKSVLSIADELRDEILPDVGVRMEDKGSGDNVITVWKLDNPEVLKKVQYGVVISFRGTLIVNFNTFKIILLVDFARTHFHYSPNYSPNYAPNYSPNYIPN